jgi:hypothetical protein
VTVDATLQKKADVLLGIARKNIERDGHLVPVLVMFTKDGGGVSQALDFSTQASKDKHLNACYKMLEHPEVLAVMVMSEAWYVDCPVALNCPVAPGDCPKKHECINATLVTRDETRGALVPIERKDGRVVTGEPRWMDNPHVTALADDSRPSLN